MFKVSGMAEHIPMSKWGKDHWSTLAYIECRIVDKKGLPDLDHMRVDVDIHPAMGNRGSASQPDKRYPTRLSDGTEVYKHDDWSCLDDAEHEGLVENFGTGINRAYKLTEKGKQMCALLRQHKADGGQFAEFRGGPKAA